MAKQAYFFIECYSPFRVRREPVGITAMKRARRSVMLMGLVAFLCGGCTSDRVSNDNLVYLTARYDLSQTLCGQRKGLTRIGGDGAIAGPKTSDGSFAIPQGQSFILTDIHMFISNRTNNSMEQGLSVYINGASGEVGIWAASAMAGPQTSASYERALTTGIRIAGPAQVCVAISDQEHPPQIVLTGYLQQ
jgi:hypothetical protein